MNTLWKENNDGTLVSVIDDGYIGRKNSSPLVKYFVEKQIQPQCIDGWEVCSIGKSSVDGKWYGWSHRAIYGFEVGSKCSWGDLHYIAPNKTMYGKQMMEFFASEYEDPSFELDVMHPDFDIPSVKVTATFPMNSPNEKIRGTQYEVIWPYPDEWGKGAWEAKTEAEAKQMAIDFAKSVA